MSPKQVRTEIGEFPVDWKISKIGECANIEGGYAFSSRKFTNSGKYQVVKMSNLYGGILDLERSASFLDKLTALEQRYLLSTGEILITLTGTTGKRDYGYTYLVNGESNLLLNQRVARITSQNFLDPRYLSYQLKMPVFLNQFFEISKGGTGNQTNVGTTDVAEIKVPFPPHNEQSTIATALSDVDSLIEKLDQLISKKRNIKTATMQQLLTGKSRLPGFSGEWINCKLGQMGSFTKGRGIKRDEVLSSGLPCIRYGEIYTTHNDYIREFKSFISKSTAEDAYRLKKNDLLFAGSGETAEEIGKCVAFLEEKEAYAGGDIVVLSPENQNSMFLGYLLNHPTIASQKARFGQGDAVVHISARNLACIDLKLPTLEEQRAIAQVISDIDSEFLKLKRHKLKLTELKQGMMQELLTGRIRLV